MTFFRNPRFMRATAFLATFLVTNIYAAPLYAYNPYAPVKLKEEKPKQASSRLLTAKEMKSSKGKYAGNPYMAGQAKFDFVYKGVNTRTGNYTLSATDLSFEGGYGIPVNISRSYSANCIDEGPFGIGWSLSADLRSTAGGMLKSAAAPVRSVPTDFRRRPSAETDPNIATQPTDGVVATDAQGKQETIQRDVDGILTTPPWDKNMLNAVYEQVTTANGTYWVLLSNSALTPDGTTYTYAKQGAYTGQGAHPWDSTSSYEPTNVLKITQAVDRQGNTTTYTYGSTPVTFAKSNGTTSENPLTGVSMPNGRTITLTWTGNRVTQVADNGVPTPRTVAYGYDGTGRLTSVTSPGGKITRYAYASGLGTNLITGVTDPRGLTETIEYLSLGPAQGFPSGTVGVNWLTHPNGTATCYVLTEQSPKCMVFDVVSRSVPIVPPYGGPQIGSGPAQQNGQIYVFYAPSGPNYVVTLVLNRFTKTKYGSTGATYYYDVTWSNSQNYTKTYLQQSMDLLSDVAHTRDYDTGGVLRDFNNISNTTYNMFGNKLYDAKTEEIKDAVSGSTVSSRTFTTEYAYWGQDKYFQQKAVKVTAGALTRYSYTDYYDWNAQVGRKGQTYKVFDNKHSAPWQGLGATWKSDIQPKVGAIHSATFDYDTVGRPVSVWKLQKDTPSAVYVRTDSVYGANGSPAWGGAVSVTEDVGGIARTTQTLAFDVAGRAIQTKDAANKIFTTTYDGDGLVQGVTVQYTQGQTNVLKNVVSYTYGTTDGTVENGQPLSVSDGLSGTSQSFSYVQSGGGKGQPYVVGENDGGTQTSTSTYTYDAWGCRDTATYVTPNGTTRNKYDMYVSRFDGSNFGRIFSRLNRQDFVSGTWVNAASECLYDFDMRGRLTYAFFAPTAQSGLTNMDTTAPASMARAMYTYDAGGRLANLAYDWLVLAGGTYSASGVYNNASTYAHALGLKDTTTHTWAVPSASTRTETYGYEADYDWLTSTNYGDGTSTNTWTYDAAGNRTSASAQPGSWTYDNLNRITGSPLSASYGHDILGNRTTATGKTYSWDEVNRMTSYASGATTSYLYRADGMRVRKNQGSDQVRWYYDGQMPVEDDTLASGSTTVTRNLCGARGIDAISQTTTSGTTWAFPVYDGHGNMVATLARGSGTTFSVGNRRDYDVWGGVRNGATSGSPSNRYCANLGHVQDDESGLVYMRARYYEPSTARFISEDLKSKGKNFFQYSKNNPVSFIDRNGKTPGELDPSEGYEWINNVIRDYRFGDWIFDLLAKYEAEEITLREFGEAIEEAWKGNANFYIGTLAGVRGSWQLFLKIEQDLIDIIIGDFDWGSGIGLEGGEGLADLIEQAAEISLEEIINLPGG